MPATWPAPTRPTSPPARQDGAWAAVSADTGRLTGVPPTPGAPPQSFSALSGQPGGTPPYTTLDTSPVTQEEPFLTIGPNGSFRVFVPALRHDSAGPSWSASSPGPTAASQRVPSNVVSFP